MLTASKQEEMFTCNCINFQGSSFMMEAFNLQLKLTVILLQKVLEILKPTYMRGKY